MTKYEIWCTVLAVISLSLSIFLLAKDIFKWKNNQLSTKTLIVDILNMENQGGIDDWIYTKLSITNKTNKEFTISDIQIIAHNLNCKIWQSIANQYGEPTGQVTAFHEMRLHSNETIKIDFYIEVEFIQENTPSVLALATPYGKFGYPIVLPKNDPSYDDSNSVKKDK